MIAVHPVLPRIAALGSFLVVGMSFVTLSFLVTTPETWVANLGGPEHGFPLLSGAGRLVVKDAIMMGAALVTMADSAKVAPRSTAWRCSCDEPGSSDRRRAGRVGVRSDVSYSRARGFANPRVLRSHPLHSLQAQRSCRLSHDSQSPGQARLKA